MMKFFSRLALLALLFFSGSAHATNLYTSDNSSTGFDATPVGTTPTGWSAITGSWSARTTFAFPGHTHTMANTNGGSGDFVIYTGATPTADMSVTAASTVANTSGGNAAIIGVVARGNSNFTDGYLCANTTTNMVVFKKVAGTYTSIANTSLGFTAATGNRLLFRFETLGTTIRCRIWLSTSPEPSTWTVSTTDASTSAAGYAGVYDGNFSVTGTNTATDYSIDTLNASLYLMASSKNVSPSGGNITVSGIYTGTAPSALNYSLDGGGYAVAPTPTITGGNFLFTIPAPSSGYHSITVQNADSGTITSTGIYNVTGSAAIFVATPSPQTVGLTYAYTGTYVGTPTALDYQFDAAGWSAAISPTISGGSFSLNAVAPSAGTHTISVRDHDSPSIFGTSGNFTTSVSTTIDPSNSAFVYSPYNWNVQSGTAKTPNAGSYFKIMFTGNTATLNFNDAAMGSPISQAYYQIDNGPMTQFDVATSVPLTIPSSTLDNAGVPYHTLYVLVKAISFTYNRWTVTSPSGIVNFTGLSLDDGAEVAAPVTLTKNCLIYGDSITEGVRTLGTEASSPNDQDDTYTVYSIALGQMLGCEVGNIGFGEQGYGHTGAGGVPTFPNAMNLIYSGVSRTFSPTPDIVIIAQGANDGSNNITSAATTSFNTLITDVGTAVPVMIFNSAFNSSAQATNLQNAIAASNNPSQFHYFPMTGVFNTAYGSDSLNLHPTGPNDVGQIAPKMAILFRPYLYPASAGGGAAAY